MASENRKVWLSPGNKQGNYIFFLPVQSINICLEYQSFGECRQLKIKPVGFICFHTKMLQMFAAVESQFQNFWPPFNWSWAVEWPWGFPLEATLTSCFSKANTEMRFKMLVENKRQFFLALATEVILPMALDLMIKNQLHMVLFSKCDFTT